MSYAYTDGVATFGATGITNVTAIFGNGSQLLKYDNGSVNGSPVVATTTSLTDGIIGWGRWAGSTTGTTPNPLSSAGVFDYVVGIPTAVLPPSGTVARYSLMGYTNPTSSNGSTTVYKVDGTLTANFAGTGSTVGVNMTVASGAANTFTISGTTIASGTPFFTGGLSVGGTGCGGTCAASVNGFFVGTNASRAGLSYTISNSSANNNIQGVAAFARNP
jgi:hypothetical protein